MLNTMSAKGTEVNVRVSQPEVTYDDVSATDDTLIFAAHANVPKLPKHTSDNDDGNVVLEAAVVNASNEYSCNIDSEHEASYSNDQIHVPDIFSSDMKYSDQYKLSSDEEWLQGQHKSDNDNSNVVLEAAVGVGSKEYSCNVDSKLEADCLNDQIHLPTISIWDMKCAEAHKLSEEKYSPGHRTSDNGDCSVVLEAPVDDARNVYSSNVDSKVEDVCLNDQIHVSGIFISDMRSAEVHELFSAQKPPEGQVGCNVDSKLEVACLNEQILVPGFFGSDMKSAETDKFLEEKSPHGRLHFDSVGLSTSFVGLANRDTNQNNLEHRSAVAQKLLGENFHDKTESTGTSMTDNTDTKSRGTALCQWTSKETEQMRQSDGKHNRDLCKSIGVRDRVIKKTSTTSAARSSRIIRNEVDRFIKTPHRKKTSLNWFPRKRSESFLERKIRMLQEAEGTLASLDETLEDSHLVLPRVEREKRQVQAAAREAMETRKAALVEAAWCRIVEAAGIPCKCQTEVLEEAHKKASEAFERAVALGVIMRNNPPSPSANHMMPLSTKTVSRHNHNVVTASFINPFDVEKEVAVAVKVAFFRMAQPSLQECEKKMQVATPDNGLHTNNSLEHQMPQTPITVSEGSSNNNFSEPLLSSREAPENLVLLMLERMKLLSTDELASLEKIVSSRGLSDLLVQNIQRQRDPSVKTGGLVKDVYSLDAEKAASQGSNKALSKPSDLGSILLKHVPRLQRDLQQAKSSMTVMLKNRKKCNQVPKQEVEGLEKLLVKHVSKLEREKMDSSAKEEFRAQKNISRPEKQGHNIPGLGEILKKKDPVTKFGRNFKNDKENEDTVFGNKNTVPDSHDQTQKGSDLASVLVKRPSRLERDLKASHVSIRPKDSFSADLGRQVGSLDQVLVKHVSRLEREKMEAKSKDSDGTRRPSTVSSLTKDYRNIPGLADILKKPQASGLLRRKQYTNRNNHHTSLAQDLSGSQDTSERTTAADDNKNDNACAMGEENAMKQQEAYDLVQSRKISREQELQIQWNGLGLGDTLQPHFSKLQLEQAAWRQAEEEEHKRNVH